MTWSESGGPEVRLPERTGLGSLITTKLAEQSLDAHVKVTFEPHGLLWKLDAPAVRMMEAAEGAV